MEFGRNTLRMIKRNLTSAVSFFNMSYKILRGWGSVSILITELKRLKPCDLTIRKDNINPEMAVQSLKMAPLTSTIQYGQV